MRGFVFVDEVPRAGRAPPQLERTFEPVCPLSSMVLNPNVFAGLWRLSANAPPAERASRQALAATEHMSFFILGSFTVSFVVVVSDWLALWL
jgi:hypothetical protein